MADKIPLAYERVVKLEGYFDPVETYKAIKDYLENDKHYDLSEKEFIEKNDGLKRNVYSKHEGEFHFSDYMQILAQFKMYIKGEDVEVEIDGKKQILTKGEFKLAIGSFGVHDFMNKRKLSPIMTFINKMLDKFYNKDMMSKLKKKASEDVEGTVAVLKKHMRSRI